MSKAHQPGIYVEILIRADLDEERLDFRHGAAPRALSAPSASAGQLGGEQVDLLDLRRLAEKRRGV
jgi:hypothetical protein